MNKMRSLLNVAVIALWSLSSVESFVLQPPSLHTGSAVISTSQVSSSADDESVPEMGNVGFVLLAGGTGSRMKASMPKQN